MSPKGYKQKNESIPFFIFRLDPYLQLVIVSQDTQYLKTFPFFSIEKENVDSQLQKSKFRTNKLEPLTINY